MPTIVNPSGNRDIDGLLWGYKWDTNNLTVRFPTSINEYAGYAAIFDFKPFSAEQQDTIFLALRNITAFTPINFSLTFDFGAGNFRFAQASSIDTNDGRGRHNPGGGNDSAEGNPPDPNFPAWAQGDTWYNLTSYQHPQPGTFASAAGLLHEFGHALGLKHGHATQVGHGINFPTLPPDHDSQEYSVMTYRTYPGQNLNVFPSGTIEYPLTFMQDDIAALQYMYGANFGANSGTTIYRFSPTTGVLTITENGTSFSVDAPFNGKIFLTIWDGNGNDTYDFSNFTDNQTIDLRPGQWSTMSQNQLAHLGDGHYARGNVANALQYGSDLRSLIENAIGGSGNDLLFGNQINNTLTGNGGNDLLIGAEGNDILNGGPGNDTARFSGNVAQYMVTASGNTIVVADGVANRSGTDTLTSVEHLQFADRSLDLTMEAKAASISASLLNSLIELYVSYFNRVPEANGLAFWIDRIIGGETLSQISQEFYAAGVQFSSVTGYTANMANSDFIRIAYANVLGRKGLTAPPDSDVAYWDGQIASGAVTKEGMIQRMLSDARAFANDPQFGFVSALIDNKVALGRYHAIDLGIDYASSSTAISQTVALAAAVTPTGISAAVNLIGLADHVFV